MRETHRIKTEPRDDGVRIICTVDLSTFTLYALHLPDGVNMDALERIAAPALTDMKAAIHDAAVTARKTEGA